MKNDSELNQELMPNKLQDNSSLLDEQLEKTRFQQEQIENQRNVSTIPQIQYNQQNTQSELQISNNQGNEIAKFQCKCSSKWWFVILAIGIVFGLILAIKFI